MDAELIAALGPRAFTPDLATPEIRKELAGSAAFQQFRDAAADVARLRHNLLHRQHTAVARDSQATEFKAANDLGELYMRIPQEEYFLMRQLYGEDCWSDPEFVEAYHRDNEWARVKTTRGTRGQEYAGKGRR